MMSQQEAQRKRPMYFKMIFVKLYLEHILHELLANMVLLTGVLLLTKRCSSL